MKKWITIIPLLVSINLLAPDISISYRKMMDIMDTDITVTAMSHKTKVLTALINLESGGKSNVINRSEQAYGILQIRQIYLDEYKRLTFKKFNLNDMLDRDKSIEVFTAIMDHYVPTYNLDSIACLHNSGKLTQRAFMATKEYRKKAINQYKRLENL
ncbi:MAG: hypothetical protein UR61_C0032G0011 [candidate division WS6 bacterium GW2011_GWE1_34_7]|uniref:Transglycosylase SLT domain-containing protein n=1 Tax=candidate division WS6 bacterium GW2011_GWE1_34_7 TaxID=1619093 RepID=A0A0G0ECK8_9BACT|nr:MAG: hypothetical protein UR61_C0032G0011 [candidate division WS6 bacterium GW2011_GWE1_34_7]